MNDLNFGYNHVMLAQGIPLGNPLNDPINNQMNNINNIAIQQGGNNSFLSSIPIFNVKTEDVVFVSILLIIVLMIVYIFTFYIYQKLFIQILFATSLQKPILH